MASGSRNKKRLGQCLLDSGLISEDQLQAALERQRQTGELLGETLLQMGLLDSKAIGRTLAETLGVSYVDLTETTIDLQVLELIPEHFQRRHRVLPYKIEENRLYVAMRDPLDVMVIDDLHLMSGMKIVPQLALESEIQEVFNRVYSVQSIAESVLKEFEDSEEVAEPELSVDEMVDMARDAPVIRLVNSIIAGGIRAGASDIHIEPQAQGVRVRYRLDGILHEQMTYPLNYHAAVVSRIKILSHLNIAERRRPQDGRLSYKEEAGKEYDIRVSIMRMAYGEKVVMRLLAKSAITVTLEQLGFFPEQQAIFTQLLSRPYGMILVTGPTGSGKSTTLYAALSRINDAGRNISTLEDPVEYDIAGVNQAQVHPKIGVTFAAGLRTLLRQDPDVIMVGEIRDAETAEIAVQAALTGHLVLSTIHTNDAPGALVRLHNMGTEPFLITSAVLGAVGQRLLRKICAHCSEPTVPDPAFLRALGISKATASAANLRQGRGCHACGGHGYRGRTAVYEIMLLSDRLREATLRGAGGTALKEIAMAEGMMTMRESGLRKALAGETTLEEVHRVLFVEEGGENLCARADGDANASSLAA